MTSDHAIILALAKEAFALQDSPMWNKNPEAKRREAKFHGFSRPKQTIPGRGFPKSEKAAKPPKNELPRRSLYRQEPQP